MSEKITVRCLRDFYKSGKGENARGFKGDLIEVSPKLAEYLSERNLVEVVFDDSEEEQTWQQ